MGSIVKNKFQNYRDYPSGKYSDRTVGSQLQAIPIITVISIIFLGGIGWRLYYLQLQQGTVNQQKAEDNRTRIVPKQPVRGNITDRNGKMLATSKQSYSAYLWPKAQKEQNWAINRQIIAQILKIEEKELQQKVAEAGFNYPSLIPIGRNLTPEQVTAFEEYKPQLKWVETDIDKVRYYPQGKLAAHILGYTGELNQEELEERKSRGYRLGDVMGKMGIESSYETQLRGQWGGLKLGVNGAGQVISWLGEKPAESGENLTLTIDAKVQRAAETALGTKKGAIVALDPHNGSVIAMALRAFPPASTFKIVTATAGMESGKFSPNTVLGTYPYLSVGGTRFGEWNKSGFGSLGFVQALAWSSNTFFGQIGQGAGGEDLIKYAKLYGFGKPTGIELEGETGGLIADDAWKRLNFDDWGWTVGDTVNMSIGQGFTSATPLQVAVMFSAIANDGYRVKPHLVQTAKPEKVNLNFKPTTIDTISKGLRAVVDSGTGTKLNSPNIPPGAGKSGTAEAPPGDPHTWFGAYAPYEKPEIVVVAFLEHSGGGGGSVAAPLVRQVMEAYFKPQNQHQQKKE